MTEVAEEGKLFVGGIARQTTAESMQRYFSKYGEVIDSLIMMDKLTGNHRGFGFVTFKDPACVLQVLKDRPHHLDDKKIDPKPCTPKDVQRQKKQAEIQHITKYKIFIGGLAQNMTIDEVKSYFEQYGPTVEVVFALHKESGLNKGFGFVTFEKDSSAAKAVEKHYHNIGGKQVEAKRAEPLDKTRFAARISKPSAGDHMMQDPSSMYYGGGSNYGPAGPNYGAAPWMPSGYEMGGGMGPSSGYMPVDSGYGTYSGYGSSGGSSGYGYGSYGSGYNNGSSAPGYSNNNMNMAKYSSSKAPARSSGSNSRSYHPYKKH